jgi:hypothetical protein
VKGVSLALTDSQRRAALFLRAFTMSVLQASGVWLIAHNSFYAGFTAFLISWNWISATRDGNDHRVPWSRFSYAAGGAVGTLLALACSLALHRMHLL